MQAAFVIDKFFKSLFDGGLGWFKGPALLCLMVFIVIALIRHPPGHLQKGGTLNLSLPPFPGATAAKPE